MGVLNILGVLPLRAGREKTGYSQFNQYQYKIMPVNSHYGHSKFGRWCNQSL